MALPISTPATKPGQNGHIQSLVLHAQQAAHQEERNDSDQNSRQVRAPGQRLQQCAGRRSSVFDEERARMIEQRMPTAAMTMGIAMALNA